MASGLPENAGDHEYSYHWCREIKAPNMDRARRQPGVQKSEYIYLFEIIKIYRLLYSVNFGNNAVNNYKITGRGCFIGEFRQTLTGVMLSD